MAYLEMKTGETYRLTFHNYEARYDLMARLRSGTLVFKNQKTGRLKKVGEEVFETMRITGGAVRLRFRSPTSDLPAECLGPDWRVDPDDPGLTQRERKDAKRAAKKVERARTILFYLLKWDARPDIKDSETPVTRLINECKEEAIAAGHHWVLSYSTLHRASKLGSPGDRSLTLLMSAYGVHDPAKRYPPFVLEGRDVAIDYFYSAATVGQDDGIARFFEIFDNAVARLNAAGLKPPKRLNRATVRRWILDADTYERHERKWGKEDADRKFHGTRPSIDAEFALQYVMIDHTLCDHWAIIVDQDGNEIFRARPWIVAAVDVYSEMILSLILTLEPPSLITVAACLKQILRPKGFLFDRYGDYKGSTSCWGTPFYLIVDNAWESAGVSFQTSCESIGIRVKWAPVRTGEYKTFVEHLFHVLNKQVWHKSKGGVPKKPHVMSRLRLKPRAETERTIPELEALAWDYIVTIRHMDDCKRRNMPRAKAWTSSLQKVKRHMLDDMTAVDSQFGQVVTATLTREGVRTGGHRFHSYAGTSSLLDSLVRHAAPRKQSRDPLSTANIDIHVVKDLTDCSFVNIWDFVRKDYVKLPNVDERFTQGLSWNTAKLIKDFSGSNGLPFETDEEKMAARAAFSRKLDREIPVLPFREARRAVRTKLREIGRVPGEIVEAYAKSTVVGMAPTDVPMEFAGRLQAGDRIPPSGIRRGRPRKSSRARKQKAMASPSENIQDAVNAVRRPLPETTPSTQPDQRDLFEIEDPQAYLARLAEDLE